MSVKFFKNKCEICNDHLKDDNRERFICEKRECYLERAKRLNKIRRDRIAEEKASGELTKEEKRSAFVNDVSRRAWI
jgi:hypothetical protein